MTDENKPRGEKSPKGFNRRALWVNIIMIALAIVAIVATAKIKVGRDNVAFLIILAMILCTVIGVLLSQICTKWHAQHSQSNTQLKRKEENED